MSKRVVVIGAGGFGREALDVIEAQNVHGRQERIEVLGVVDDSPSDVNVLRLNDMGVRVLGGIEQLIGEQWARAYVLGIGNPLIKARIDGRLSQAGFTPVTIVHPSASIGSQVKLCAGTVVCGGVQVSTNVFAGRHVHLNPNATIGHDTRLGDFVSVNPGAIISGEAEIGDSTLVGAGSVVLQGLTVGPRCTVGASACVTREVSGGATVVGVPARQIVKK